MIKLGSIVRVVVSKPDGCDNTITYGDIGIVTEIEHWVSYDSDYTVHTYNSDFVYGIDQIRELTDEECREALKVELMRRV